MELPVSVVHLTSTEGRGRKDVVEVLHSTPGRGSPWASSSTRFSPFRGASGESGCRVLRLPCLVVLVGR